MNDFLIMLLLSNKTFLDTYFLYAKWFYNYSLQWTWPLYQVFFSKSYEGNFRLLYSTKLCKYRKNGDNKNNRSVYPTNKNLKICKSKIHNNKRVEHKNVLGPKDFTGLTFSVSASYFAQRNHLCAIIHYIGPLNCFCKEVTIIWIMCLKRIKSEVYSEFSQTSKMDFFCENI